MQPRRQAAWLSAPVAPPPFHFSVSSWSHNRGKLHWCIASPSTQGSAPVQMTKEELVQSLRRQSKGYHQNSSQYRGVTKHQKGKWEARIGQVRLPHLLQPL